MNNDYRLERFIDAQQGCYDQALSELKAGYKRTHWMWFIFPQLAGLGTSDTARHYAISSLDEARAYMEHPLLGARLGDCTAAVNAVMGRTAHEIFGTPDNFKFHSSMTLFHLADPTAAIFQKALQIYYAEITDKRTLALLSQKLMDFSIFKNA